MFVLIKYFTKVHPTMLAGRKLFNSIFFVVGFKSGQPHTLSVVPKILKLHYISEKTCSPNYRVGPSSLFENVNMRYLKYQNFLYSRKTDNDKFTRTQHRNHYLLIYFMFILIK